MGKMIVAVDDEPDILDLISYSFRKEGYEVRTALSGEEGLSLILSMLAEKPADCILLDLMLPGIDGMSLCRKLKTREETRHIPVIMLTAKGSESDIVAGLELGADDYITKPFSPRVLLARVRACLRKQEEAQEILGEIKQEYDDEMIIDAGKIRIDLARHEVYVSGNLIELSATEFMILSFLARNPGWVFSRNRIIDGIRGKDYPVTERSVDVQILGLRKKLGEFGDYIQTVRGVGYRLMVE